MTTTKVYLVQVRLGTEVLRTPSSNPRRTGVRTHNLQIMTVHFMSLTRQVKQLSLINALYNLYLLKYILLWKTLGLLQKYKFTET